MALMRPTEVLSVLLMVPLALPMASPSPALASSGLMARPAAGVRLAQAVAPAGPVIPAEVLGWADQALAAMTRGDRAEAVRLLKQVLGWVTVNRRALQGFQALLHSYLAVSYRELGLSKESLSSIQEAVRLYREQAKTNPAVLKDLVGTLTILGNQYSELGRPLEALAPVQEVVQLRRVLAKTNPVTLVDLADALNNLGTVYDDLGRRQEALAPADEAVQIYRGLSAANPAVLNDLAGALTDLGSRYSALGRDQEALAATQEALTLLRQLAKSNPAARRDQAAALTNSGVHLSRLGRHQEALASSIEAVKLQRELVATANPAALSDLAGVLTNLGNRYSALGRHREALAPTDEAVTLYRKLAQLNPAFLSDLARVLNNLGIIYDDLGRRQEALAPSQEAVNLYRELAKTNPAFQESFATIASNLAVLQLQLTNPSAALVLLQEAVSTEVATLQAQLPLLPEARRMALVERFGDRWQIPFSQAQQGEAGAALALFTRLNRQGLLQDIQRSQALLARSGPQRPLFEQLKALTAQLAGSGLMPEQQQALQARREELEQQLYRQLPQLQPRLVEPSQIAPLLPSGGALLEFQRFRSADHATGRYGSPRYLALLLRPDGRIRAIPLGEAAPIDAAVAEAVAASADPRRQEEASEALAAVSRLVLAPLQQELTGLQELFVSPDGELNRLPFAALPLPAAAGGIPADGPTLGDSVALRLLTTGRDLLRLQQPARIGGPAALIANPDFNAVRIAGVTPARLGPVGARPALVSGPSPAPSAALAAGVPALGSVAATPPPASGLRSLPAWPALAGTEQEARQLAPLLGVRGVISGPAATASVVLAQRSPRILHIATHGFFLADQPAAAGSGAGSPVSLSVAFSQGAGAGRTTSAAPTTSSAAGLEDPLQRSGLVFAGANRPAADVADDGYLTAAEATAMELEGTELVTLSACETGLGGARSGEGVYGLQRALTVAGARATLLSLWKVDDAHTVTFMELFYRRLKAGEGRAEALRHTQAEFRNHKNSAYHDIRVWGAFQLSGDWRPLPRW